MPHHHHHHRRHDVYDDTHQQQYDPSNEVTVHRHQSDVSSRRHRPSSQPPTDAVIDPFHDMQSMWHSAERDMDRAFGPFSGFGGIFGSMMTSMDRMFDQVRDAAPSGGTYYYESRKMTVGPDGRVHEETVRTVPDEHGNPHTSRTVRDGDNVEHVPSYAGRRRPSRHHDDVVIEEVDEHGDPISEDRVARRYSRDERDSRARRHAHAHSTGNWFRDRYNQWRSRA